MKFGILKERKSPPDRRTVFSPNALSQLQQRYPEAEFVVESSDVRVFSDEEYTTCGIKIQDNIADCDVLIGVKEVPVTHLIPDKKYFFFSHTIKKQLHNQKLLQAVIEKKIDLYDHETIVDANHKRLIGFGRYAGIVGAYNAFRAFGMKYELFVIPKAETLADKEALITKLKRQILPPVKIVVSGKGGRVANGVLEILEGMKIKKVSPENFLSKKYAEPVFTQLEVLDYNIRADGKEGSKDEFYSNPEHYVSHFERFSKAADIYIAGHFYGNGAPIIVTQEMLAAKECTIKVIADISCDVNGPIAATIRSSTIAAPFYGYLPSENKEVDMFHPAAIVVMAVDNLPCELPKDASEGFGEMFMEHVIPAFFDGDKNGILARAKITESGRLTARFDYLKDYASSRDNAHSHS